MCVFPVGSYFAAFQPDFGYATALRSSEYATRTYSLRTLSACVLLKASFYRDIYVLFL